MYDHKKEAEFFTVDPALTLRHIKSLSWLIAAAEIGEVAVARFVAAERAERVPVISGI